MRKLVKATMLTAAAATGMLVVAAAWLVFVSGPPIDVTMDERGTLVDTIWLGEYFTASSVIDVVDDDGQSVLRLESPIHDCTSLRWRFNEGINRVPTDLGDHCTVEVPREASTFRLKAGKEYRFTIVGSNGFGHIRRSSRAFRVAVRGGVSSNKRVNAPVRPVTALANSASAAPVRPARYAQR